MNFEDYKVPLPVSVSPDIPQDTATQMGPVDKMAQLVIPKLVDKLNLAEWKIARLEAVVSWQSQTIDDLYRMYNDALKFLNEQPSASSTEKTKPKSRAKKSAKKQTSNALSYIADYDPDTDIWSPKAFGAFKLTGVIAEQILHMGSDAALDVYPAELVAYVFTLPSDAVETLKKQFPN